MLRFSSVYDREYLSRFIAYATRTRKVLRGKKILLSSGPLSQPLRSFLDENEKIGGGRRRDEQMKGARCKCDPSGGFVVVVVVFVWRSFGLQM